MSPQQPTEQRAYRRYIAKGRAMAVVPPNFVMPYPIINISINGLAFGYTGQGDWPKDIVELDIYNDQGFSLNKVPGIIISDCSAGDGASLKRRCCVEFGDLSPEQKERLAYFIDNHTIGLE